MNNINETRKEILKDRVLAEALLNRLTNRLNLSTTFCQLLCCCLFFSNIGELIFKMGVHFLKLMIFSKESRKDLFKL